MFKYYDVIVVGAGHAGCEAAAAAANMGSHVLLITMDMTKMGQMSCNPAMGGIAKGQIVREIDALGGISGIVTDKSTIQFRMLNKSKGPAMWSPRAQCDRIIFSIQWREELEKIPNVDFWQDTVTRLLIEKNQVQGVETQLGVKFHAKTVILTNGTFINGFIHVGRNNMSGGRVGELASFGLSEQLLDHGFNVGRMKTGTPARIDGRTIDFSNVEEQKGEGSKEQFSFLKIEDKLNVNKSCYITYTNTNVHDILATGFKDSPLYNGTIKGIGPRYCPSIEDKIVTFADKEKHQLFLEPEGLHTNEFYINGFSSSLPLEIQLKALRNIRGLGKVEIFRPGYAIEYDYYPPVQLYHTLETRKIQNLFFAGQINGTTGYEEAAAQGLMAGINCHFKANDLKEEFVLTRDEAYIGVLIDDLINKGVDEPYRMFTSRAEYRVLLRQDNADERLTEKGYKIGLARKDRVDKLNKKLKGRSILISDLEKHSILPVNVNNYLQKKETSPIKEKTKIINLVARPQVKLGELLHDVLGEENKQHDQDIIESAEIEIKYKGYIQREKQIADKIRRLDNISINENFDYNALKSISTEARQKLDKIKPKNIGQASRISGVSPSDINVILVHLGR